MQLSLLKNEPTEFVFRKTGNFWMDNGIVNLHEILSKMFAQKDKPNACESIHRLKAKVPILGIETGF